ncbi:plasma membrane calcium [Sporothrix eucalyptigena]|uniref:Plasma membrane calcium n=1 Tax=Sporothrix eucalyptigena TaxID=1812306 RepID=A0ABP0AZ02_9PEZI
MDKKQTDSALAGPAPTKFAVSVEDLRALHTPKNLDAFCAVGGLRGLEKALLTNRQTGLNHEATAADVASERNLPGTPGAGFADKAIPLLSRPARQAAAGALLEDRKHVFGDNFLPTKRQPTFLRLVWMAYNDPVLFLLTGAAAVSLAIGLYQALGTPHSRGDPGVEWVEGVAILVAVVIIVLVGSINDWEKLRQFKKLNRKQLQRDVIVIRSGAPRLVSISEVLVGDVVSLEPGDVFPADGILISGHSIVCDESTATGESDAIHKSLGDDVYHAVAARGAPQDPNGPALDPFILSGTKVLEGVGTFLVTATGANSTYGKVLASLKDEPEPTPLQERLSVLAKHIAQAGGLAAILLFVVLLLKFLGGLPHNTQTSTDKGQNFIDILIISLTVLVIAVPEGLPLAVTLSLAFTTTRMMKDNNLVRRLKACEIMGNATDICSDKTGTLTLNKMEVAAGAVGAEAQFHNALGSSTPSDGTLADAAQSAGSLSQFVDSFSGSVQALLLQSIALNSTAFEQEGGGNFIGSDTESALLNFAQNHLEMRSLQIERASETVTQVIPFSAVRQCMATVIKLPGSKPRYRVFVKGASEIMLAKCSKMIQATARELSYRAMDANTRKETSTTIETYARHALRTIVLSYRDIQPPAPVQDGADNTATDFTLDYLLEDLVFIGVFGIYDPLRPGVPEAVTACQNAGVTVRMVTGDNLGTAKAIARQCGILSSDEDVVMEGTQFRNMSDAALDAALPHLKVLARSSPSDKERLVVRLRETGKIVAVTGDGTNDAAALSAADVGFSMGGLSGTEVAREASDIVLTNDDFTSVVKAIMWGRAVNDSTKKFLQFQITITLTSVMTAFISAIANADEQSVLTPVQLMWVNLFQDTMAALALATDAPQKRVLDRNPEPRAAPLINTPMWKTIIGQSVYQIIVTLVLYFAGSAILSVQTDLENQQLQTLVFNTYVWLQIFNMCK